MGAMTVKGPSDLRTSRKPAFSTMSKKLESSGSFSISSTIVPARAPFMTNANTTKFILSETPEMTKKKLKGLEREAVKRIIAEVSGIFVDVFSVVSVGW